MLTHAEALALTQQIHDQLDAVDDLIVKAFTERADVALGYSSWQEYTDACFPKKFKLTPQQRLESVVTMTEAGMTTRQIGAALGVGRMTVSRDITQGVMVVPNGTVPEKPATGKTGKKVTNKQSKKLITEYAQLTAENPLWNVKQITQYLVGTHPSLTANGQHFGHQDTGRLRMWATAPEPVRQAYFDGKITAATGETILASKMTKHLQDEDKIVLVDKVVAGLIGTSAPAIRKVMELMPQVYFGLRQKWKDPTLAWTYNDLLAAQLAQSAQFDKNKRDSNEFINNAMGSIKIDYGLKAQKWIDQTKNVDLPLFWQELPAIMALTFQAEQAADDLEEISKQLWALAHAIRNKGVVTPPAPRPAAANYGVVDADVIDG
jgi:hypothetical protein